MARLVIRKLDPDVLALLELRARRNGRSLEDEARTLLEEATRRVTREDSLAVFEKWRRHWGDRVFSDSAELIREDRERSGSGQRD